MTFDVILQKRMNDGYTARPLLWPDSTVYGTTEQEALERVRALIRDLLEQTQFVQVDIETSETQKDNPWIAKAGMFADDPTWDDFLQAMTDYRRQLDEEQAAEPT
ncbi:MAG: hypothetical protein HND44_14225 [Chloroflexi bacterium]|nr:hypothetical protein [Ardenticatenaceae bacterium]MBL1129634.1 hypothetical protein [Chloroflexota bacterium]NOG35714.1 hypothetical protein [Chloroflexota bacterium]GIK55954.1 MAG: hypothetical protein BroJett015_16170 [Chloroflexota bacterium]